MIEPLLLAAARIFTFEADRPLTNASGFFFARGERLFLVTSRHVVVDAPTKHFPDRIEIELHVDPENLAQSTGFSIPLYRDRKSIWRTGEDSAGDIDVAVIELERDALPHTAVYKAFTPAHLVGADERVEVGSSLLVVGFPLGFHDTLHHMPVVRHAIIASSFGLRFQGEGYFLTDARTHRGTSGAPVVMRVPEPVGAAAASPIGPIGPIARGAVAGSVLPVAPSVAAGGAQAGTSSAVGSAQAGPSSAVGGLQAASPFTASSMQAAPSSPVGGAQAAPPSTVGSAQSAALSARNGALPGTRSAADLGDLPWKLLGVHSARLDVGTRDLKLDEALGLNCAWYADILLTLTDH